jgi:hypothetical protein
MGIERGLHEGTQIVNGRPKDTNLNTYNCCAWLS